LDSSRIFFLGFGARENSRKARAISELVLFDLLDLKTQWDIRRAEVISRSRWFRAELGKIIGKRDSIWGRSHLHCVLIWPACQKPFPG
jgi:hypothetical protein